MVASPASQERSQEPPRLELVPDEPLEFRPPPTSPQPETASTTQPSASDISAIMRTIAMILAVRLLLLLTLLGAVALALMAMTNPNPMTMAVLAIYCVLAVLPMVWLERTAVRK